MKNRILIILFLLIYIVYHLISLNVSPLPWFDEVVFASISNEFASSGKLILKVAPYLAANEEITVYGPIYFFFTSTIIKLIGLGIFQFRIISLLFGFLCVVILYKYFKLFQINKKSIFLCLIIFLTDPIFNSSMHGGRMDTMALFFALCSIYCFLINLLGKFHSSYKLSFLSSLFAALAILTTPRVAFLLLPIFLFLIFYFLKYKKITVFISGIIWVVTIFLFYSIWFLYAFDSFDSFLRIYSNTAEAVKVGFFIPKLEIPLIITTATVIIISICYIGIRFFSEINIFSILIIILFYLLVDDTGAYSVYISPFYVFLIGNGMHTLDQLKKNKLINIVSAFILTACISIFALKGYVIFSSYSKRDPNNIAEFISINIPKGSKIIGDEKFYYAALDNDCDFQFLEWYKSDSYREKFQREVYQYDFLLASDRILKSQPNLFLLYSGNSVLIKVAELKMDNELNLISKKIGFSITDSYDCIIYKRKI